MVTEPGDNKQQPAQKAPNHLYAIGMLASIALVLAGLFIFFPALFAHLNSKLFAVAVVFLCVPLVPAISGWLQGEYSSRLILRDYLIHTVQLASELGFLLIVLPFIAVYIVVILNGIFLFAISVGWILLGIKLLGIPLKAHVSAADAPVMLRYWLLSGGLELLSAGMAWAANRYRKCFFEMYADFSAAAAGTVTKRFGEEDHESHA
jgi:hypothetical protein